MRRKVIDTLLTERRDYSQAVSLLQSLQSSKVVALQNPQTTQAVIDRFRDRVKTLDAMIGTLEERDTLYLSDD